MVRVAKLVLAVLVAVMLVVPGFALAKEAPAVTPTIKAAVEKLSPQQEEIAALFDRWNASLATGKPEAVAANYAPTGVLIPTVSNKVRTTPEAIKDYFVHFLELKPVGKIVERHIRVLGYIAIDSGLYDFTVTRDGKQDVVGARYTFVYQKFGRDWKIIEHHSSKLPEPVGAPAH